MARRLTKKQTDFASFFIQTGNGAESARRAGYAGSDNTLRVVACKNLKTPGIKSLIAEKQARRNERLELAEDFELKSAMRILEKCMADREILDTDGEILRFDAPNANRALSLIAQLRGKLTTKTEVTSIAAGAHEGLEARRQAALAGAAVEAENGG